VGVEEGSSLIRKVEGGAASVHDSAASKALASGDEKFVGAEKAYESQEFRAFLKALGIVDYVMCKARKNMISPAPSSLFRD
jgi:hypothetical protein